MKESFHIIREQLRSLPLIARLAVYDMKSQYQIHYLGILWQWLNPLIQVFAYWFVFGMGLKQGASVEGGYPFIIWMLAGIIPWFFISPTLLQGASSIYKRINLVAKMNFPVSALPTVAIVTNLFTYFIMIIIYVIILLLNGYYPTLYWLQYFYYLLCMVAFMFSLSLFNSTISIIVRDYQQMLQAVTRLLFFLTPIFWSMDHLEGAVGTIIKLNPFYYIIDGFRNTFLYESWFFNDVKYGLYFWLLTLLLLMVGSIMHMKFRDRFVDFL